ncbi:hypothetical protein [Leifsonia sp. NPDC058230]|uniref:hypothetical protein n=1 Tax=Leifsonia sp. NPDC058230 TaxID=3346391 RepID=UPI0036DC5363
MTQHNTFVYVDIGLRVTELSPTQWRVSDTRRPDEGEGSSPIGFIEQTEAGFEVTDPGEPGRRIRFRTFTEAMTMLSRRRGSDTSDPA